MTSPRAVHLTIGIRVPQLPMFVDRASGPGLGCNHVRYFAPGALAFGAGDAAGEGLATGLALVAGAVSVVPVGEDDTDGAGLAVCGVFELFSGSVAQPAANMIEKVARSRSAVRLITLMLEFFIIIPHSNKIEKRDDDCPGADW